MAAWTFADSVLDGFSNLLTLTSGILSHAFDCNKANERSHCQDLLKINTLTKHFHVNVVATLHNFSLACLRPQRGLSSLVHHG